MSVSDDMSIKLLSSILKELQDDADEGEVLSINGTVQSNDFTFIETITAPGHPVKGYAVINDDPTTGGNAIFVAHNTTKAGLQPDFDNITSNISRFRRVNPGEEIRFIFNRRRIYNVAILANAVPGTISTAAIRGWLVW